MNDSVSPLFGPASETQRSEHAVNDAFSREAQGKPRLTLVQTADQIQENFDQFDKDSSGTLSWFELSLAGQRVEGATWMRDNIEDLSKMADVDKVNESGVISKRPEFFRDEHPSKDGISKGDLRVAKFMFQEIESIESIHRSK